MQLFCNAQGSPALQGRNSTICSVIPREKFEKIVYRNVG